MHSLSASLIGCFTTSLRSATVEGGGDLGGSAHIGRAWGVCMERIVAEVAGVVCRWDCARRCGERVLVGVRVRGGVGWEMGGARGGCGNHGDCSGNGFIPAASGEGAHMAARGVDGDAQVHKMADVLQVRFVERCRHHHSGALLSCLGARAEVVLEWILWTFQGPFWF